MPSGEDGASVELRQYRSLKKIKETNVWIKALILNENGLKWVLFIRKWRGRIQYSHTILYSGRQKRRQKIHHHKGRARKGYWKISISKAVLRTGVTKGQDHIKGFKPMMWSFLIAIIDLSCWAVIEYSRHGLLQIICRADSLQVV